MIIITGPDRSGTSFIAKLYRDLGIDLLGNNIPNAMQAGPIV